jgi:hypothetical protein
VDHFLVLRWTNDTVQMELDDKTCSNDIASTVQNQCFLQITMHDSRHHYLNTNGPLHVGGVSFGPDRFGDVARLVGVDRYGSETSIVLR